MADQDSSLRRVSKFDNTDMEAFYASIISETSTTYSPSHVSVTVTTSPSEETQKAMQILQDLVSKKFSLLLHPGRSRLMKDTLKYLLSLPADQGFSIRTESAILQLSQSFDQWSLDYENAGLKFEEATAVQSKAEKVGNELEANVKEFQDMDKEDKCLCDQLASLQEEKRDLEEKINAIKTEIANSTAMRNMVAKRKIELFHKARVVKAERDDLTNHVPRLKAEREWAKNTRANIEAEWSKVGELFIGSTDFKE